MSEQPRPIVKSKSVIGSFLVNIFAIGYVILDGYLNTESVMQKIFGERFGRFISEPQGKTTLIGVSLISFLIILLYKFHQHEISLSRYYEDREMALVEKRQSQIQSKSTPKEIPEKTYAKPNFECTGVRISERFMNLKESGGISPKAYYVFPSERLPAHILTCNVALAKFYYEPTENVPPFLYVSAHVFFESQKIYAPIWDTTDTSDRTSMQIFTAHTSELVIALQFLSEKEKIYSCERSTASDNNFPSVETLEGESFPITVTLIGKYHNEVKFSKNFKFMLYTKPELRLEYLKDV